MEPTHDATDDDVAVDDDDSGDDDDAATDDDGATPTGSADAGISGGGSDGAPVRARGWTPKTRLHQKDRTTQASEVWTTVELCVSERYATV